MPNTDDIAHLVALVIGYLIAMAIRYVSKNAFWKKVADDAKRQLEDPNNPVSTPDDATASALLSAHARNVNKVAKAIEPKIELPQPTDGDSK
jgi:hypothetical protein